MIEQYEGLRARLNREGSLNAGVSLHELSRGDDRAIMRALNTVLGERCLIVQNARPVCTPVQKNGDLLVIDFNYAAMSTRVINDSLIEHIILDKVNVYDVIPVRAVKEASFGVDITSPLRFYRFGANAPNERESTVVAHFNAIPAYLAAKAKCKSDAQFLEKIFPIVLGEAVYHHEFIDE